MTMPTDKDRESGDRGGEYQDEAKEKPPVPQPDAPRRPSTSRSGPRKRR